MLPLIVVSPLAMTLAAPAPMLTVAPLIVRIEFTERQPYTSWSDMAADEYGFYANVNPAVDHPRWSQASERRIAEGASIFKARIATLPFNGYAEQVASLYAGMDPTTLY